MKNFKCFTAILLIATMFVSFNACSSDDEDDKKESLVIGKWRLTDENGSYHTHLEFKSNGTFEYTSSKDPNYEEHGIWKIESDILYMLFSDTEDDWFTSKILVLNSTSLVFEDLEEEGDGKSTYQRIN